MRLRELRLVYSAIPGTNGQHRKQITCPRDAAEILRDRLMDEAVEVFGILLLDTKHRVNRWYQVSRGTLDSALVHPRGVFCPAIRDMAASVILAHNHPSGCLEPSAEDIEFTRAVKRAGELMGIELYDHLIVTRDGFTSLRERGLM